MERYLDDMSNYWKSVICVGSGNEGTSAGHTSGMLKEREEQRVELGVQQREPALNVQLWKSYVDEVDISVIGPSGVRVGPISERLGTQRFRIGGTEILLYYGKPSPYQTNQEIYFDFIPTGSYIDSGVWQIVLTPRKVVTGIYQMWLPSQSVLNQGTAFLNPVSSDTLTIPSTASRVVTVGAYDARSFFLCRFFRTRRTGEECRDVGAKARSCSTGSAGNDSQGRRRLRRIFRYLICSAVCDRKCGIVDGVGNYPRE